MSFDPLSGAAISAAAEARRLRPWVYGIFVLAVVLIVAQVTQMRRALQSGDADLRGEAFDLWLGVDAFLRQALRLAPAFALAAALWYAQDYLHRIEKGGLWAPSTATLVTEIGGSMTSAAALEIVIAPTLLAWLDRDGPVGFDLELTPVVLGGLGLALVVIGRGLRDAIGAAGALKSEHDQIV